VFFWTSRASTPEWTRLIFGRLITSRAPFDWVSTASPSSVRRAVPRRIHHRIQFDRIHTFEHRPSPTSPALLRCNSAWIAVGRRLGLPIEHGFSIDGCDVPGRTKDRH
jgi:hypothetical protein